MKQLLFLLFFPCLAMAQYQGNANQKITLGEQTTADGLVWRGRLNDTSNLLTNKLDTSVYIVLDTGTRAMWYYRASTTPKWTRLVDSLNNLQGQLSLTTKVTGVLPVENGGTGSATQNFVDLTTTQSIGGVKTFTGAVAGASFRPTSSTIPMDGLYLPSPNSIAFSTNGSRAMIINSVGAVGFPSVIGTSKFTIDGNFGFAGTSGNRYLHFPETGEHSGRFILQAGFGSSAAGGAINLFGHGNTSKPGWVTLGISSGAGSGATEGRFTVNSSALANGIDYFTVLRTGNVGIGTTAPAVQLHTTGGVRFAGLTSITDLRTDASGNLFNGSDFNLKNSIDTINFGLSDVLKLKPVSFNWNDEQRNINEYKSMGFIAQDVMNIIPNAASTMGDGDMQVDYNAIVATLTKAIQEQQSLIKALEQRILNLENK